MWKVVCKHLGFLSCGERGRALLIKYAKYVLISTLLEVPPHLQSRNDPAETRLLSNLAPLEKTSAVPRHIADAVLASRIVK